MDENKTPKCIGIIMDGNRRWAKQKGLPLLSGHQKGYEKLKACLRWAREKGIKYVIFYAFSTENWNRSKEEVSYLMNLLKHAITNELDSLREEKAKVRIIGKKEMLGQDFQDGIKKLEEDTKDNDGPTLVAALSYGGRLEILEAVNRAIAGGKKVDEASFESLLWTEGIPDPDIIIRTGGDKRLSGFLPFFCKIIFPESILEFTKWTVHPEYFSLFLMALS